MIKENIEKMIEKAEQEIIESISRNIAGVTNFCIDPEKKELHVIWESSQSTYYGAFEIVKQFRNSDYHDLDSNDWNFEINDNGDYISTLDCTLGEILDINEMVEESLIQMFCEENILEEALKEYEAEKKMYGIE